MSLRSTLDRGEFVITCEIGPLKGTDTTEIVKNSELLNKTGLNIPLHPNLSEDDISYIIKTIKEFGSKYNL